MGLVAPRMARHNAMTGAEMVSNQSVMQHLKPVRATVAGLVLVLSAGCQLLQKPSKPEAELEAPAPVVAKAAHNEENAIETALANDTGAHPGRHHSPASPVLRANAPDTYTVRRGDTPWAISRHVPARPLAVAGDLARQQARSRILTLSIPATC